MKETCSIIFSYILLHFIEMYMLYLAACKPRITQRESGRKKREEKHKPKKKKKRSWNWNHWDGKKARHQTKTATWHPGLLSTAVMPLRPWCPAPADILLTGIKEEAQVGVSRLHLLCEKPEAFRGHWHGERTGKEQEEIPLQSSGQRETLPQEPCPPPQVCWTWATSSHSPRARHPRVWSQVGLRKQCCQ